MIEFKVKDHSITWWEFEFNKVWGQVRRRNEDSEPSGVQNQRPPKPQIEE